MILLGALLLTGIVVATLTFTRGSGFSIIDRDCPDDVRYGVALTVPASPEADVVLVDGDGGVTRATRDGRSFAPSFSPDGTKIAFTRAAAYSDTMGFERQWIVTSNVDGSDERKLTDGQHLDLEAAWSPHGNVIVFTRADFDPTDRDYAGGLMSVPASGGEPRVLLADDKIWPRSAEWSPDGKRIAFLSEEDLYVMNADGSDLQKVASGLGAEAVAWSPDGKTFAFESGGIYTLTFEEPNPRLWRSGSEYLAPDFSPDGTHFLYIVRPTGRLRGDFEGTRALVEPIEGGEAQPLAEDDLSPEWVGGIGGYGAKDWLDCP